MQICLLGGTFDPPHWGHVLLAEALRTALDIQQIIFVPANIPPHKTEENISAAVHRIRMLAAICEQRSEFQLDTREIDRQGTSYSVDTVREVKEEWQLPREEIGFFIGADNFTELSSWKDADNLVRICRVVVAHRPGVNITNEMPYYNAVEFVKLPIIELSSSQVRQRVRQGLSISYFVLPEVENYILENRLYI